MSTTTSQPPSSTNEKRSLSQTAHQMTSPESKRTLSSQFIDESDLVLNDLNAIIESHSANNFGSTNGHKSSFKKKAESFRKLAQADSMPPKQAIDVKMVKMTQLNKSQSVDMPPEVDLRSNEVVRSERLVPHPQSSSSLNLATQTTSHKLKSKSYLVNSANISRKQSSGSQQLGPSHGAHPSTIFLSHMPPVCFNSSSIVANSGNATISGLKTKKLTNLNINVLPQSLAPATCLINTAKKKRASLFNLFSFSKSATSNNHSNQSNSVSIANSECNLSEDLATPPTAKLNKSLFNLKASSASTKCISTSIEREKSRQHDVQLDLNAHNPSSTVSLVHHSTTPSPDRWHTNLKQLLTKKVSKKEKKAPQPSTRENKLITPKSNDDDLLLAEFDSSPCLSSFKLTTCDAENKTSRRMSEKVDDVNESTSSSSSSVSVSPIGSSRSISPPCIANNNDHNSSKQCVNLSKTPSIRSRGFSIPLNASVCLNTTNFLNYQAPASTRLTSPRSPFNCHVRFLNYSLKQSMQPSHDDLTIANKSNHLCIHTDQCEADENELIDDESIEFPIVNSFDLRKEVANSCLREVNLKLRYAQIKHIDELPADENQPIKSDRSANETSNESEPTFSQFRDALRESQAEQHQQVHEEVERSDFSQVKVPNDY